MTGWEISGESKSGADNSIEVNSYGNKDVKVTADGSIGSDTYKLMRNSTKNVSGATLIQEISGFPVNAARVTYSADMYVMVVKNDTEIIGSLYLNWNDQD